MFKKTGNPIVEELNKTHRERSYNLSDLKAIIKDGGRLCAWCGEGKLYHGNAKYCTPECSRSAMAWAYPQKEEALCAVLMKQDFKCNMCQYDYSVILDKIAQYDKIRSRTMITDYRTEFIWAYFKRLKSRCPKEYRPEMDHIVPIYKGGQAIGLDNLQCICYTCHKGKTGKDLSGKRKSEKPDSDSEGQLRDSDDNQDSE